MALFVGGPLHGTIRDVEPGTRNVSVAKVPGGDLRAFLEARHWLERWMIFRWLMRRSLVVRKWVLLRRPLASRPVEYATHEYDSHRWRFGTFEADVFVLRGFDMNEANAFVRSKYWKEAAEKTRGDVLAGNR